MKPSGPRIDRSGSLHAIEEGFAKVQRQVRTIATFGVPAALNIDIDADGRTVGLF